MRQGVDLGVLATVAIDSAEAGEGILAINVHGARTTNTLSAGPSEGKSRIHFVLNLDESIENLIFVLVSAAIPNTCGNIGHKRVTLTIGPV